MKLISCDPYNYRQCGRYRVAWKTELEGGGASFGQSLSHAVAENIGPTRRCFEFCAGYGLIGFSLLERNLCTSLCMADVNPEAVRAMRRTVELNGLSDRVDIYEADGLEGIPESERWDLVVGNPPHFGREANTGGRDIIAQDPDWQLHKRFYGGVSRHLNAHATVMLLENASGSSPNTFLSMIERGGLEYVESFMCGDSMERVAQHYIVRSRRARTRCVSWPLDPQEIVIRVSELSSVRKVNGATWRVARFRVVNDTPADVKCLLQTSAEVDVCITANRFSELVTSRLLLPPGDVFVLREST